MQRREKYAVDKYGGFCLATFASSHMQKIYSTRSVFHTESIGASAVKITHKTEKLFKFLKGPTQHKQTRVSWESHNAHSRITCSTDSS